MVLYDTLRGETSITLKITGGGNYYLLYEPYPIINLTFMYVTRNVIDDKKDVIYVFTLLYLLGRFTVEVVLLLYTLYKKNR